jgi:SAM-dependent methyltransferase
MVPAVSGGAVEAVMGGAGWAAVGIAFWVVVLLFPWILRAWVAVRWAMGARGWRVRVLRRYRGAGAYAWMFAWFKTWMDPMYGELPGMLAEPDGGEARGLEVLDVGCGYGCAGCAVLEWVEGARVFGVDPDAKRVRAAGVALGERGRTAVGAAPDLTLPEGEGFDVVMMLDMVHYLGDEALAGTLRRVHERMKAGGRLILRANVPAEGNGSWKARAAESRRKVTGERVHLRTVEEIGKMVMDAGFTAARTEISGGNAESWWVTAGKLATNEHE